MQLITRAAVVMMAHRWSRVLVLDGSRACFDPVIYEYNVLPTEILWHSTLDEFTLQDPQA